MKNTVFLTGSQKTLEGKAGPLSHFSLHFSQRPVAAFPQSVPVTFTVSLIIIQFARYSNPRVCGIALGQQALGCNSQSFKRRADVTLSFVFLNSYPSVASLISFAE